MTVPLISPPELTPATPSAEITAPKALPPLPTSRSPPATEVPLSTPKMNAVAALLTVVPLAKPPEETVRVPPSRRNASRALPPFDTIRSAEVIVRAIARPPDSTVSLVPSPLPRS
jgi:hypothetical protein